MVAGWAPGGGVRRLREGVWPSHWGGRGSQCPGVTGSALCPLCGLSPRPPVALGRERVVGHVSSGARALTRGLCTHIFLCHLLDLGVFPEP